MSEVRKRMLEIAEQKPKEFYHRDLFEVLKDLALEYVKKYGYNEITKDKNKKNNYHLKEDSATYNYDYTVIADDFLIIALKNAKFKDNNLEEVLNGLYISTLIEISEDDIKNGRVYSLEEVDREMEGIIENYIHSKSQG